LGAVNATINLFPPRFDWQSRRWEEEGTLQSTGSKVDTEEKKEVKSEDTTITLSRGCSNPSSVDHSTIDIKSDSRVIKTAAAEAQARVMIV
jgi:hypothetical protein